MSCKDKISDRCSKKINALCVTYEGTLVGGTLLDPTDCHNLEEVIEDLNTQIDQINSEITLTHLVDSCITYDPAGDVITVEEAIMAIDAKVCELVALTGLDTPDPCPTCIDDCDAGNSTCNNGIIYHNFSAGAFPLTVIGTWKTGVTTTDQYSTNLQHVAPKTGKYKYTVEVRENLSVGSTAKVGLKINAVNPIETNDVIGYFSSTLIDTEGVANITYSFIQDLSLGDSIAVAFKLVSGTQLQVNAVKLIVEKIG
jgi:hypothetical protein